MEETTWGNWSPCTVTCGGGWRKRVGKCVGTRCYKWKKEIERCNTDPCPTPPPPPPPTTPPPPPPSTTTPPPPPPTTPPPPPPPTTPPPPPPPTTPPPPPPSTTTPPPPPPTTPPPPPPSTTTPPPPPPTTPPPPPPSTTTPPPPPPTTPEPDDCDTTWTKIHEHEADGTATFGDLAELLERVSTGGSLKVWDRVTDVLYTGQTVLELDGNLCTQSFFDLSISDFDTFQDDVYWSFDFLCTTGDVMETRYNVGEQVNVGIVREDRALSWFVRDIVQDVPLYENAINGTTLQGSVQNLVDSILRGEDFRLTIGNGLRIPAANIEFQGEGSDTLVVEMGIFESSRQVVDSKGNDIYEFLANGMDVWWFTLRTSAGMLNLDRWKIGEHEQTQTTPNSTFTAKWYADSCWRQIYKSNASGSSISGSVADLISAADSGSRVRVVIGTLNLEADDIRIENGVLCGSFLNRLTKQSFDTLDPDIAWFWTIACTSGTVRFLKYKVGNTDLVDTGRSTEDLTWFVDDRVWTKVLVTGADGSEVSGSKSEFLTAVQNGGDIRYRIAVSNEIEGFALSNTTLIQQADTLRWSGNDVSAMHIRSVGIVTAGLSEVDFIRSQYWCFSIVSTNGKLEVSRWFTGVHTKKGDSTDQVSVEWFVNT